MDDLPNELILEVFSNLSYFDLKRRVPLVCKRFHALLQRETKTGDIDKILFRDMIVVSETVDEELVDGDHEEGRKKNEDEEKVEKEEEEEHDGAKDERKKQHPSKTEEDIKPNKTEYTIHPVFQMLFYNWSDDLFDIFFNAGVYFLNAGPVIHENAVSPAVHRIEIRNSFETPMIPGLDTFTVVNDSGGAVTVLDVMGALVTKMTTTEYDLEEPPSDDEEGAVYIDRVTSAFYQWDGFDGVEGVEGGGACLNLAAVEND